MIIKIKNIIIFITSEQIGVVAFVYSHFLILKRFKINNKYIIFKIIVKYKIKKIRYVKRKICRKMIKSKLFIK